MPAASAGAVDGAELARRIWKRFTALAESVERLPRGYVLGPLFVFEWLTILSFALRAPHNGWLYFHGGDATEYWAHEWAVGHGYLPLTALGYGVPILFGWVPALFGPSLVDGLPAIVLVQTLVLAPIAVAAVYGIASRIAGRLFALWAAIVFVAAPHVGMLMARADYRPRMKGLFLPQSLGLVNLGDFPSVVVLLGAGYFLVRTLDTRDENDTLIAGLLTGLAFGIKPSNAVFLPVPVIALLVARRWRAALWLVLGMLPAALTLLLWKYRGLGNVPLFAAPEVRLAAGQTIGDIPSRIADYLDWSYATLHGNEQQIREFFWSRLLLLYLPLAGAFACIRRSPPKGIFLLGWAASFYVIKGGAPAAGIRTTSFFRLTMPGFPAYAILAAAVVLLVPTWSRRQAAPRAGGRGPRLTWALGAAVAAFAALPLAVVAAERPLPRDRIATDRNALNSAPISSRLGLRLEPIANGYRLRWRRPSGGPSDVFYVVYRSDLAAGDGCVDATAPAHECYFAMPYLGRTGIEHLDDTPLPGSYYWRVAMFAAPTSNADDGDLLLISPPIRADVRCSTDKCIRDLKAYWARLGQPVPPGLLERR